MSDTDKNTFDDALEGSIDTSKIAKVLNENLEHESNASDEVTQYVSFTIGEEEYCVDIIFVREIKGWVPVTPLPNSPSFMLGVLNLRGVVVPIFDMRNRFGMGTTVTSPLHVMIIVSLGDRVMGILVDTVSDILSVKASEVMSAPDLEQRGDRKFLSGLITHENHMVSILSLEKLFDLDSIVEQLNT